MATYSFQQLCSLQDRESSEERERETSKFEGEKLVDKLLGFKFFNERDG